MMKIEVWSDVVCPWCYVGKRNLERALGQFAQADKVEIEWKSFELNPDAPPHRPGSYVERISKKYGIPVGEARARMAHLISVGAEAGIDFRFDDMQPGNTFEAHRLLHLAKSRGVQNELKERLFLATFTEGHPIGVRDTLAKLAADVGIPEEDSRRLFESRDYAQEVRDDEVAAMELGVTGVPFFVFDRRFAAAGAQPPDTFVTLLERAWREANPIDVVTDGVTCEGDVCEI
jgi:predicted DsbA family dithiol-disulfide isomerase